MSIDYLRESNKYRPKQISVLLVGESPPPSGRSYFYVPRMMSETVTLAADTSLPATIFGHYFNRRPTIVEEYVVFLKALQEMGVFLIDICDDPIAVRNCPAGVERIRQELKTLKGKMRSRNILLDDESIIFLLARQTYLEDIRREFPTSRYVRWKDFRLTREDSVRST